MKSISQLFESMYVDSEGNMRTERNYVDKKGQMQKLSLEVSDDNYKTLPKFWIRASEINSALLRYFGAQPVDMLEVMMRPAYEEHRRDKTRLFQDMTSIFMNSVFGDHNGKLHTPEDALKSYYKTYYLSTPSQAALSIAKKVNAFVIKTIK